MGLLDGRVALVTGSGRGIGREFALCFAREGARVVVNDVGAALDGSDTGETPAEQVCKEIEAIGGEAVPNRDSVTDFDGARNMVQSAVDAFGTLDILVNNAGIVRDRTLLKMDESDFDAVVGVHLKGTFNCGRHAAEVMKEKGYGRIINITSSAGLRGNFGQTNYGAAKAGIMGLTFVWSLELGRYGITVNAVAPAGATRMTASLYERSGTEPPPEEHPALNAPLLAFLASEQAAHVNGQVLGRTEYSYTIFQHPKQIAWMGKDGGWTPAEVAAAFDKGLGQHLQQVGMVMPASMQQGS
jgi:NAD(P)-dependent dehydrogenase (short-subunit alcohol dehydrogenase family)